MNKEYFSKLLPQIAERSGSAALSRLGFSHVPLYRHLKQQFSRPFGEVGSFLADPSFEATFGWEIAKLKMCDLANTLLTTDLVRAMDQPPKELAKDYRFASNLYPYMHQLESWQILANEIPQSLVVASGTGSGKTECFMVPILDRLTRLHQEQKSRLIGVRALFLYPLNALINSQRERLRAWTYVYGENLRFCLFNGNTPNKIPAHLKQEYPSEVMDRDSLRASPPPILVTNATMLEYMLVRTDDAPILEKSQGKLEWVVLDEAHTYIGSQAAELSLLIRRVLHAFGVSPDTVRFVATSATIGDPNGEAGEKLKCFLADVAGVSLDRVHLVSGKRHIPLLPPEEIYTNSLEELSVLSDSDTSKDLYNILARHKTARDIRSSFIESEKKNKEKGGSGMVARLSDVCRNIFGNSDWFTLEQQINALRWLDLLSGTCDKNHSAFLPLRAHLFHQTISGIWACADPNCNEKCGSKLEDKEWPFGQIYFEMRKHCRCGSPIYELVACDDCGTPHLIAAQRGDQLVPPINIKVIDEFELDIDANEEELNQDDTNVVNDRYNDAESSVLIVNRNINGVIEEVIDKQTRQLIEPTSGNEHLRLRVLGDSGSGLICPCCQGGSHGNRHRKLFQEARIGAPFSLGIILPSLLEFAPDGDDPAEHPYRGRRLLTFNDSRQGTARIAAKLQQESERDRIRGLVYHLALRDGLMQSDFEAKQLKDEIQELENIREHVKEEGKTHIENLLVNRKKQLASLSKPKPISFEEMSQKLTNQSSDFERMLSHYRNDISYENFKGPEGSLSLARMFLIREFGRRPKRLNNLESMGLVSVQYPALNNITRAHEGFSLIDWISFLKIALDFFVRAGGSLEIPEKIKSWLGMPFPQTRLVDQDRVDKEKTDRRWPRAYYTLPNGNKRLNYQSTLVRILACALKVDIETSLGADKVDAALTSAWRALTEGSGILYSNSGGRRVLPLSQIAFTPITNAWICPLTRRFLDTTIQDITPYLPLHYTNETVKCQKIEIPLYDQPFGGDASDLAQVIRARDWLSKQESIIQFKEEGLWPVLNDRAIELSPYFVTAEHSAQQPAYRLDRYEKAFKSGDLNLLSCSTTMEMGIDIGGIATVAMNNVPPHPANYLQRAGRAGRRQEARSISLTLCKSNPHDQLVFSKTDWPFVTALPAPAVSLNSELIIQRHVNSLILKHFFSTQITGSEQDVLKLTCGWFFISEDNNSFAERFIAWCIAFNDANSRLLDGIRQLVRRSRYEGVDAKILIRESGKMMHNLYTSWFKEWDALERQKINMKCLGVNSPAYKAVQNQLDRTTGEYLLKELATGGFLPAYGFPTHITVFDNLTISQIKRNKLEKEKIKDREDNNYRHRELASRDRITALREYAPGAEVVMDGLVYRSAGITLNWKIPATEKEAQEIQAIRYAWHCDKCNHSGSSLLLDETRFCLECGTKIKLDDPKYHKTFIEPAGFAVDFLMDPDNDVSTQDFIPVELPWVSANGEWISLPNPALGRYRVTTRGHMFYQSSGLHGKGYAICLACGRAEPMVDENIPNKLQSHYKLRGGNDQNEKSKICIGSHENWAIKPGITLGHQCYTDVLEIQLKSELGIWIKDKEITMTLAVALRSALADLIGIQTTELGCDVKSARTEDNSICRSILIFDRYAAGYSSSASQYIENLFRKARNNLNCPVDCDSACPSCILDFDQRFVSESLNRLTALEVITENWLSTLRLPERYQFFGVNSRVECSNVVEAILRTSRKFPESNITLFAGGAGDELDFGASNLRNLIYQIAASNRSVSLVIEKDSLSSMDMVERHLLAGLIEYPGRKISLHTVTELPKTKDAIILAEICIKGQTYRWGVNERSAINMGLLWGNTDGPLIVGNKLEPLNLKLESLLVEQLRLSDSTLGDIEIEILKDLDGSLQGFGQRFWKLVSSSSPNVASLFSNTSLDIEAISYHDRYLFSPLPVALLLELITGIRTLVGTSRWNNPFIEITTNNESANLNKRSCFIWDNWLDLEARNGAIINSLDYLGIEGKIKLLDKNKSLHGRMLEVKFSSNYVLTVRLDQGVSYWKANNYSKQKIFNFGDPDLSNQGIQLAELNVDIESNYFPTHVFIKVRQQ